MRRACRDTVDTARDQRRAIQSTDRRTENSSRSFHISREDPRHSTAQTPQRWRAPVCVQAGAPRSRVHPIGSGWVNGSLPVEYHSCCLARRASSTGPLARTNSTITDFCHHYRDAPLGCRLTTSDKSSAPKTYTLRTRDITISALCLVQIIKPERNIPCELYWRHAVWLR